MTLRTHAARARLAVAALLLASGCGMYGDLYLEEPEAPPRPEVEELEPIAEDAGAAGEQPAPEEEDPAEKPKQPPPDGAGAMGSR